MGSWRRYSELFIQSLIRTPLQWCKGEDNCLSTMALFVRWELPLHPFVWLQAMKIRPMTNSLRMRISPHASFGKLSPRAFSCLYCTRIEYLSLACNPYLEVGIKQLERLQEPSMCGVTGYWCSISNFKDSHFSLPIPPSWRFTHSIQTCSQLLKFPPVPWNLQQLSRPSHQIRPHDSRFNSSP